MPKSRPRRRPGHGELIPPSSVSDRIDSLLKEHLAIFPSKAELTQEEYEHWHGDLGRFSIQAIEYAFEEWRRNGHFFPVYDDILQLCKAWQPNSIRKRCGDECESRHGKGYGTADVLKLWQMHTTARQQLGRQLTEEEWEGLYGALDHWRGGAPEFRKTA